MKVILAVMCNTWVVVKIRPENLRLKFLRRTEHWCDVRETLFFNRTDYSILSLRLFIITFGYNARCHWLKERAL